MAITDKTSPTAPELAEKAKERVNQSRPKLLMIDDDKVSSRLHASMLSKKGFDVTLFHDPLQGLNEIPILEPDVVILDWVMPEISGIDALHQIREHHSPFELPVLMLTSMDKASDLETALAAGANDYLTKPMEFKTANARIRTQLHLKNLHLEKVKHEQLEALSALIVTYNHEINNPLTVAYGAISRIEATGDMKYLVKVKTAIEKVAEINRKIRFISSEHFKTVEYANGKSMVDWK